ncbi:MAG: hypothetical protein ABJB02_02055 [Dokdonella sp.]
MHSTLPNDVHDAAVRAQAAFDQSSEPQWTLDISTAAPTFNKSWIERIDAHPTDWLAAVYPLDRARMNALWARACTLLQPMRAQARLRLRDGSTRWHQFSATPLRAHPDAEVSGWGGLCVDIDDCKRVATTVRAEQEGISAFMGQLNHDLRNRVAALAMSAQVLQHDDASAEMRARAQAAVQRQAFSITERIESLSAAIEPADPDAASVQVVELGDVLESVRETMAAAAREREIELVCERPAQAVTVQIDTNGLQEACENLVWHALDQDVAATLVLCIAPARQTSEIGLRVAGRAPRTPPATPKHDAWEHGLSLHIASRFAEANGGCVIVRDDADGDADATFDLYIAATVRP